MKLIIISIIAFLGLSTVNKPEILTVYTTKDLLHIDKENLSVSFESSEEILHFDTFEELNEYVEDYTVKASLPSGYADNLKYHIDNGSIKIDIEPILNKKGKVVNQIGKTTLYYYGMNWSNNPENDTIYTLGTFLNSETYSISYDEFKNKEYQLITISN